MACNDSFIYVRLDYLNYEAEVIIYQERISVK